MNSTVESFSKLAEELFTFSTRAADFKAKLDILAESKGVPVKKLIIIDVDDYQVISFWTGPIAGYITFCLDDILRSLTHNAKLIGNTDKVETIIGALAALISKEPSEELVHSSPVREIKD